MFHLKDTAVSKTLGRAADVSTIELAYEYTVYETCIFWQDGRSEVIARYDSEYEASQGHVEVYTGVLSGEYDHTA